MCRKWASSPAASRTSVTGSAGRAVAMVRRQRRGSSSRAPRAAAGSSPRSNPSRAREGRETGVGLPHAGDEARARRCAAPFDIPIARTPPTPDRRSRVSVTTGVTRSSHPLGTSGFPVAATPQRRFARTRPCCGMTAERWYIGDGRRREPSRDGPTARHAEGQACEAHTRWERPAMGATPARERIRNPPERRCPPLTGPGTPRTSAREDAKLGSRC